MKNYIIYCVALLLATFSVDMYAQRNAKGWSLGAGARMGLGSMMQKSDEVSSDRTKGFDGAGELVFTSFLSRGKTDMMRYGFRTGLSLGYRQNSIKMGNIDLTYSAKDAEGNAITYHATAKNVKETDRQFALEIPVMFAVAYNRLFGNVGLRFGIPAMSRYSQTMEDPSLSATYDEYEVTIRDEKVTGVVSNDDKNQKAELDASSFNMCVSLEAGYEFKVIGHVIQAGIYVDYGLVDNFKGKGCNFTDADPTAIDGATSTPTTVIVHSLTDSYVSNVGIFCVGVRGVYNFKSTLTGRNNSFRHKSSR